MKCQILFSGKNKKNISICRLLKILPRWIYIVKLLFGELEKWLLQGGAYCLEVTVHGGSIVMVRQNESDFSGTE